MYIPKKRDLIWLNFEPQAGREIQKIRPALVLSPYNYHLKTGLALCVPITSRIKGYPFEVLIQTKEVSGAILCDHLRSLDWKVRAAKFISVLDQKIFESVLEKLHLLLDLD